MINKNFLFINKNPSYINNNRQLKRLYTQDLTLSQEKNKILNVFEERLDFLELYVVQYISRLAIEYIVFNLAILQIVL